MGSLNYSNEVDFGEVWGTWICPDCGTEHYAPDSVTQTHCKCGQEVTLSFTDCEGNRAATKAG